MPQLKLNSVTDSVMAYLQASAEETGRTVEEVAIEAIENGIKLDKAGLLALAKKARSLQPTSIEIDSTDIIRRLRDAS